MVDVTNLGRKVFAIESKQTINSAAKGAMQTNFESRPNDVKAQNVVEDNDE